MTGSLEHLRGAACGRHIALTDEQKQALATVEELIDQIDDPDAVPRIVVLPSCASMIDRVTG